MLMQFIKKNIAPIVILSVLFAMAILGTVYGADSYSIAHAQVADETASSTDLFMFGGRSNESCTISTTTAAVVGDDVSSTVLAANGARAWARIQQLPTSVNGVYLNFGIDATVGNGLALGTTSASIRYLDVGLNEEFAYTGAITGITDTSSTTVLVTECIFY